MGLDGAPTIMFTGIIETRATVLATEAQGTGLHIVLEAPSGAWDVRLGESIAVCGVCLTVAKIEDTDGTSQEVGAAKSRIGFDISTETLERTWFRELEPGRVLNLERSLRLGDRLDGHLVYGHVDAVGKVVAIEDSGDGGRRFRYEVPQEFQRWLVDKGSVAIDGTSLTVCDPSGKRFDVAVIPITLEATNLGLAEVGQRVNLEADPIGKWVERLIRHE
jgi:riboflavin synthase